MRIQGITLRHMHEAQKQGDLTLTEPSSVLVAFNASARAEALAALLSCCAAHRWAAMLADARPFANEEALYAAADAVWAGMGEADWMEAFRAHPRIGERKPAEASTQSAEASTQSTAWSSQEQAQVHGTQAAVLSALAAGNCSYEDKFGMTYIVCATGRSAEEMLAILERRLGNDRASELSEAAEQQRQITQIRLRKWLRG